jgi:hypothetical protein
MVKQNALFPQTPPPDCDLRINTVGYLFDDNCEPFLRLVGGRLGSEGADEWILNALPSNWQRAPAEWKERYGSPGEPGWPGDILYSLDFMWAETSPAFCFPYDGPTQLSAEEVKICEDVLETGTDLTIEQIYLYVECFGLRPGQILKGNQPSLEQLSMLFNSIEPNNDPFGYTMIACMMMTGIHPEDKKVLNSAIKYPMPDGWTIIISDNGDVDFE